MIWFLLDSLIYFVAFVTAIWIAGAIYFDVCCASAVGRALAISWVLAVLVVFMLWLPPWKPFMALLTFSIFFLSWWFSQKPSHDRQWDVDFARLPRLDVDGDTITIENVRNTEYRALADSTTSYETRSYRFSQLQGVDVLILYWGSTWMCHPMFIFDFGQDGRVCISIEVRYRAGQDYSFFRSLYRQQEIMYVVSDERDAILRRTKWLEGLDLYLYRLHPKPLGMRHFFFEYANSINLLAEQPRWYHGLTTNCTTSIYIQGRARLQWDWRMLFNGALDRFFYDHGFLNQDLPFESLKQQSRVNDVANRAPADGFGDYIRRELPGYQERDATASI